jgi:hypothetical protein
VDVLRIRDGLWRWTAPHPDWKPSDDGPPAWPEQVGCVYYEAPAATVLIDPLVPSDETEAARFYEALDRDVERRRLPVSILRTLHWHERSCAALRDRYATTDAWPDGVTELAIGDPDGEVALWITEHRALVPGDIILGSDVTGAASAGGLMVAPPSWHREPPEQRAWYERSMPAAIAPLAALDADMVLVSHGTPVLENGAAALTAALRRAGS